MPVDWHGVRHTVVTYSNIDEMALLERMLQGSRELTQYDMTYMKFYFLSLGIEKSSKLKNKFRKLFWNPHPYLHCRLRTYSLKTIRRQFEASPPAKTVHMLFGAGDRVLYSGDDNF